MDSQPEDVSVLDQTGTRSVTLVTCYPFYFIGLRLNDSSSAPCSSRPKGALVVSEQVPESTTKEDPCDEQLWGSVW